MILGVVVWGHGKQSHSIITSRFGVIGAWNRRWNLLGLTYILRAPILVTALSTCVRTSYGDARGYIHHTILL